MQYKLLELQELLHIPKNTLYKRLKEVREENPETTITEKKRNALYFTEAGLNIFLTDIKNNPSSKYKNSDPNFYNNLNETIDSILAELSNHTEAGFKETTLKDKDISGIDTITSNETTRTDFNIAEETSETNNHTEEIIEVKTEDKEIDPDKENSDNLSSYDVMELINTIKELEILNKSLLAEKDKHIQLLENEVEYLKEDNLTKQETINKLSDSNYSLSESISELSKNYTALLENEQKLRLIDKHSIISNSETVSDTETITAEETSGTDSINAEIKSETNTAEEIEVKEIDPDKRTNETGNTSSKAIKKQGLLFRFLNKLSGKN